ncbi:MAG: hypothetical protein ACOC33_02125 [bacterium]
MGLKEYITEKEQKDSVNPKTLVEDITKYMKSSGLKDGLCVTTMFFEGKGDLKKISEVLDKKLGTGIKGENELIYDGGSNYNVKIKNESGKIKAKISRGTSK